MMQYTLYVSSFSPNTGSIRGGTTVTVYGEGFRYVRWINTEKIIKTHSFLFKSQNCADNKVSFGANSNCKVIDCTSQWIRCQTSYANTVYQINNNGYDTCNMFISFFNDKYKNII
jgi:hypothetical protein